MRASAIRTGVQLLRFTLPVLAALLAALAAQPAAAQVTAFAAGQGAVNRIEVGIDVRASVRARCGFAASGAPNEVLEQGEFDRTGITRDFAIRLNCSGASRIAVASRNGGLAQDVQAPGFASRAPYDVQLRVLADDGTVASAKCEAVALAGGGTCAFGGTASATNGLRLGGASTRDNGSYLRVSAPPYSGSQPLLAGQYSDTLTITVSVAP